MGASGKRMAYSTILRTTAEASDSLYLHWVQRICRYSRVSQLRQCTQGIPFRKVAHSYEGMRANRFSVICKVRNFSAKAKCIAFKVARSLSKCEKNPCNCVGKTILSFGFMYNVKRSFTKATKGRTGR